jgi:hypothetical protein
MRLAYAAYIRRNLGAIIFSGKAGRPKFLKEKKKIKPPSSSKKKKGIV